VTKDKDPGKDQDKEIDEKLRRIFHAEAERIEPKPALAKIRAKIRWRKGKHR
jgi:hypothetical protein